MTRKRFVKLLMGCGISRNEARVFANLAQAKGVSYATFREMPLTRLRCSLARVAFNARKTTKAMKILSVELVGFSQYPINKLNG